MINLLSSTAFYIVNKKLARSIGIEATLLLADLISKNHYFENSQWFFNTEKNIERDTTLSAYKQRQALKVLREHKIIVTKRKGTPARQFFMINHEILIHLISCEEIEQQVVKDFDSKSASNPTTINKNKEIKINNYIFKPPTFDELKVYCDKRNNDVDVQTFLDFYISKGWMIGKNKMKDWKACVRTWETRNRSQFIAPKKSASKIDAQLDEYKKGKNYL